MSEIDRQQFSDEEKAEIFKVAGMIADCGQETIDDLARSKVRLCMNSIRIIDTSSDTSEGLALAQSLSHEVQVIDEVLRQARTVRQFMGLDDLSELDRHAQEEGLGSIFDKDSLIGASLKKHLQ